MAIFEGLERKFRRVSSADGSAVFGVLLQHILEFIHPFQKIGARDPVGAMGIGFPGIGEIVGGSEREERLEVVEKRIQEMNIDAEELWWYLDLRRFGSVPHSGFGLGFGVLYNTENDPSPAPSGQFYWGGYFRTHFFIDPTENIIALFMTQKLPYGGSEQSGPVPASFERRK